MVCYILLISIRDGFTALDWTALGATVVPRPECPRGPRTFVLKSSPIPPFRLEQHGYGLNDMARSKSRLTPAARKPVDRLQPITSDRNGASSSRSVSHHAVNGHLP
ncbi:hypothetical protein NW754_008357 [Fusarium falciforme]|uniref:Uncharacterized protein n=1 Tax=Fusarium falciforme TaxID=195108 RepID=A0A9W8RB36_9HYPO|nr:hypothetical protein NW754_008357 [Fusarium falciforme]KAJ4193281.1 hypothetical protein NW755_003278 [Fusarium falciforme]